VLNLREDAIFEGVIVSQADPLHFAGLLPFEYQRLPDLGAHSVHPGHLRHTPNRQRRQRKPFNRDDAAQLRPRVVGRFNEDLNRATNAVQVGLPKGLSRGVVLSPQLKKLPPRKGRVQR